LATKNANAKAQHRRCVGGGAKTIVKYYVSQIALCPSKCSFQYGNVWQEANLSCQTLKRRQRLTNLINPLANNSHTRMLTNKHKLYMVTPGLAHGFGGVWLILWSCNHHTK